MTATTIKTGWVACDYTDGDRLDLVAHGDIRATEQEARVDQLAHNLEGVRYVAADGYLYVEQPTTLEAKEDIDHTEAVLYRYHDAKAMRNATADELAASIEAAEHDGGAGVIEVDGVSCYVQE